MAADCGIPTPIKSVVIAASVTPIPPGTGMIPENKLVIVFTSSSSASVACSPKARKQRPSTTASISCAAKLPPKS